MKRGVFVTGTSTGVGKTFVSALLLSELKNQGARYFKPVQSGDDSDTETVLRLTGLDPDHARHPIYSFKAPLSPNLAAQKEGAEISIQEILNEWGKLNSNFWIVEGAGGLLVPLNDHQTMRDLVKSLDLPLVVIASTELGTINHTLLTLEAARNAQIPVLGVILNTLPGSSKNSELSKTITEHSCVPVFTLERSFPKELLSRILEYKKTPSTPDLILRDQKVIWHPYTQHGIDPTLLPVSYAKGSKLVLREGTELIDGISSWWVNLHGHGHPAIIDAIQSQARTLDHVLFAGFSHEPAVQLAETLIGAAQSAVPSNAKKLQRCFYSDNGSTAVEVALKMSFQFYQNRGIRNRTRFLALSDAYHGDTLGAMAVGEREGFHKKFATLLPQVDFVSSHEIQSLRNKLSTSSCPYAAVIAEPLVQGAAGMKMHSPEFLQELEKLCTTTDTLLILDEVFTGFYRTGTCFAFEQAGVAPDLLCLSKGITGGVLPLAATLATEEIFQAFSSPDISQAFLHGHSYTANPIACAAALASWKLLHEEECQNQIRKITQKTKDWIQKLSSHPQVLETRSLGTIGAVEMRKRDPQTEFQYFSHFPAKIMKLALQKGVLLRPLGQVLYAVPPYCTSESEIDKIYSVMLEILDAIPFE